MSSENGGKREPTGKQGEESNEQKGFWRLIDFVWRALKLEDRLKPYMKDMLDSAIKEVRDRSEDARAKCIFRPVLDSDLENLRHLSSTHRSLHDQRRKIEFRVLFTILTFYVAVAGFALSELSEKVNLPDAITNWAVWIVFGAAAAISSIYLRRLNKSNLLNMNVAEKAEDEIAGVLYDRGYRGPKSEIEKARAESRGKHKLLWRNANWLWQASMVIIFAFAAAVITIGVLNQ